MSAKIVWLFAFMVLYWGYCLFWGGRCGARAKTADTFFIAGRALGPWLFVVAATATSFGAWVFIGYPGLVYRDGLSAATIALVAVVIPLTGVLFLKRQWMLGRRFGYITPGEMLADYFRGDAIRFLVLAVALVFAIPFLALQLGASGFLISVVTDGAVSRDMAMWGLALVLLAYVTAGGLRAVACVASLQCILFAAGMIIVGSAMTQDGRERGHRMRNHGFLRTPLLCRGGRASRLSPSSSSWCGCSSQSDPAP